MMFVYSNQILSFIKEIKYVVKHILSHEVGLTVTTTRFYDQHQKASYPIHVVIYNNKNMLGYFDSHFFELGFHEHLMHVRKDQLRDGIRHELAHYLTFINHGKTLHPHGIEFRSLCQKMGWGEEVYKATICLETQQTASSLEESSILRRVKKLLALAASTNQHEAEQAMIKSQQLLLQHNLEFKYLSDEDAEKMYLKRILKQKKENAKMRSIAKILETFFVNTVFNRSGGFIHLEILGSAVNIEIAEYVAGMLETELDKLWNQAKQVAHLRGMVAKNSFFLGIARGYCDKIQALKRHHSKETANALIVIEKKLSDAKAMAYPHLSTSRRSGHHCGISSSLGEQMGRQLTINPAIIRSSAAKLQLSWD